MPKYRVTIEEHYTYSIDVEAADAASAGDLADDMIATGAVDADADCVGGRSIADVEKIND